MALKRKNGKRIDSLQGFRFRVILPLFPSLRIGFDGISGLEQELDVAEYREGDDIATMRKFPGLVSYPNVVLSKGLDVDGFMFIWFQAVMDIKAQNKYDSQLGSRDTGDTYSSIREAVPLGNGLPVIPETDLPGILGNIKTIRQDVEIACYDNYGNKMRTWLLKQAFPAKLSTGDLDASSSDVVIEQLELAHEGLVFG